MGISLSVLGASRAPPPPPPGWSGAVSGAVRIALSAATGSALPPPPPPAHSVAESICHYILSAVPALLSMLPSLYLLRQGNIAVTVTYFSTSSLYVGIGNCLAWMLHDFIVARKELSVGTVLSNGMILIANFHILVVYYAAKRFTRLGYAIGGFVAVCVLVIMALAQWSLAVPVQVQFIFGMAAIGTLVVSHFLQICDIFKAPSNNYTREIGAVTIFPSLIFNFLNFLMTNYWHREQILEQVASAIGAIFCFFEMFLLILFKSPDMDDFGIMGDEEIGTFPGSNASAAMRNDPRNLQLAAAPPTSGLTRSLSRRSSVANPQLAAAPATSAPMLGSSSTRPLAAVREVTDPVKFAVTLPASQSVFDSGWYGLSGAPSFSWQASDVPVARTSHTRAPLLDPQKERRERWKREREKVKLQKEKLRRDAAKRQWQMEKEHEERKAKKDSVLVTCSSLCLPSAIIRRRPTAPSA